MQDLWPDREDHRKMKEGKKEEEEEEEDTAAHTRDMETNMELTFLTISNRGNHAKLTFHQRRLSK